MKQTVTHNRIDLANQGYVLFDGDCGICTSFAELAAKIDERKQFRIDPYQIFSEEELAKWGITYEQCAKKMQVISRKGTVHSGALGMNYFFFCQFPWSILVALLYLIPILLLFEVITYAVVAKYRHRISHWLGLKACLMK